MMGLLALLVVFAGRGRAAAQDPAPQDKKAATTKAADDSAAKEKAKRKARHLRVFDYEDYQGEFFAGPSILHANPGHGFPNSWMYGWHAQITQWAEPWFGMTVEASGYYGKIRQPFGTAGPNKVGANQISTMAGPRFRPLMFKHASASVYGLFGTARSHVNLDQLGTTVTHEEEMKLAFAVGMTAEVQVHRWLAWGVQPSIYMTRFAGQTQKDFRLSTGPVIRFARREK